MNDLELKVFECLRSNCSGLREYCARWNLDEIKVEIILNKWVETGVYESGIDIFTGWLTDEGLNMDMEQ